MEDITEEEAKIAIEDAKWIRRLERVLFDIPDGLWLFATGGALHVMAKKDGQHDTLRNGGMNQKRCMASISVDADGGDW